MVFHYEQYVTPKNVKASHQNMFLLILPTDKLKKKVVAAD